ncbi:hypothetical protein Emed_005218 [Eimeria media]
MCGSGTLLLELLSLAAGLPPNSPRRSLPFVRFSGHQRARFEAFLECLRIFLLRVSLDPRSLLRLQTHGRAKVAQGRTTAFLLPILVTGAAACAAVAAAAGLILTLAACNARHQQQAAGAAAAAAAEGRAGNTAAAALGARLNVEAFRLRSPRLAQKDGTHLEESKAAATAEAAATEAAARADSNGVLKTESEKAVIGMRPGLNCCLFFEVYRQCVRLPLAAADNNSPLPCSPRQQESIHMKGSECVAADLLPAAAAAASAGSQQQAFAFRPEQVLQEQREPCVLLTNLPYGLRSGDSRERRHLIQRLEAALTHNPSIETACVIARQQQHSIPPPPLAAAAAAAAAAAFACISLCQCRLQL